MRRPAFATPSNPNEAHKIIGKYCNFQRMPHMEIMRDHGLRIIHLTDGKEHQLAVKLINSGKADGINLNYIRNRPDSLEFLANCPRIRALTVNPLIADYSIINTLSNLEELSVYTDDRKEIRFDQLPNLREVAIFWRPRAKSLFECSRLERLFLGKYRGHDLLHLAKLTNLRYLRVNTGSVKSLAGISNLLKLEVVYLALIPSLHSIDGLQFLPNLKELIIDDCKNIGDIATIKKLPPKVKVRLEGSTPKI